MGAYLLNETSIGDIEEIVPVPHWRRGTSAWLRICLRAGADVAARISPFARELQPPPKASIFWVHIFEV
jgi:hypothetical protein